MFLCKKKSELKKIGENCVMMGPFGPLVVTHKENRKKLKNPRKKFKFEEDYGKRFEYFNEHKNCKETEFLWKDQLRAKILRHFSKDKK